MNQGDSDQTAKRTRLADCLTEIPAWVVVICSLALALFVFEVIQHLRFPWFAVHEPWQGLQLPAAARILEGELLYPNVLHDASFYAYPPMLPWIYAMFLRAFGIGVFPIKLAAALSCAITLGGIYYLAHLLSRNRLAGLLAIGFYLSFFEPLRFGHILVTPDNIATCFALWATIVAYRYRNSSRLGPILVSAGLFAMAALCKQTFAVLGAFMLAYLIWARRPKKAVGALSVWVLVGSIFLIIYSTSGESFFDTLMIFSRHHVRTPWQLFPMVKPTLLLLLVPISITIVDFRALGLLAWQVMGALAMGLIGFSKWGGDVNGFLTVAALTSPLMVMGLGNLSEKSQAKRFLPVLVGLIVLVSTWSSADRLIDWRREHNDSFAPIVRFLEENKDKRVYYPRRNYLTYVTIGQYYHCDWMSENLVQAGLPLPEALRKQVADKYFDYILGDFTTREMRYLVARFYEPTYIPELRDLPVWVPR